MPVQILMAEMVMHCVPDSFLRVRNSVAANLHTLPHSMPLHLVARGCLSSSRARGGGQTIKPAQKTLSCLQGERGEALEVGRAPASASHTASARPRASVSQEAAAALGLDLHERGGRHASGEDVRAFSPFGFGWKRKHGGLRERGRYKSGDAPYYVQKVAQAI